MSEIQQVFQGTHVFVTGATGFLGQLLVEKLLRTCHGLEAIYLLVRPKKGDNEQERLKKIFDGCHFERLKREKPGFHNKVHLISGDMAHPGLGLSSNDRQLLTDKINIVFHSAATVRFNEKLSTAYKINVEGTNQLLQLAREMQHLQAFVYISTAYSNCPLLEIDEKFYPPAMNWRELKTLVESLDEETLDTITPNAIGDWPNTYSFTKCVAEDLVREFAQDLPLAVTRPSIVVPTVEEPMSCWINNFYGAAGIASGVAMGLIRVMRANGDNITDLIPADLVVNSTIAAAWRVVSTSSREPVILNFVSSTRNAITYRNYNNLLTRASELPALVCIWCYSLTLQPNKLVYTICSLLLHTIPAIIVDTAALLLGKQPRLLKGYLKVHSFIDALAYFGTRQWTFKDNNLTTLWRDLSDKDKKLFNFDITSVEWEVYLFHMLRGVRIYVFKEGFETVEKAKVRYNRFKLMHSTIELSLKLLIVWTAYKLLAYIYNSLLEFEL